MKKQLYILPILLLVLVSASNGYAKQRLKTPAIYQSANRQKMNAWVDSVYSRMTVDERIGQLFMPVVAGNNTEANKNRIANLINNQYVGGLLFSKGTPLNQAELTNHAQSVAKTPLMISLDGEWGLSMRLSNTTNFPRNMMLGAIQNDSLLYYYGLEVARQCKLMGIHVNFAPSLDVNSNPSNPVIGTRSFGEDPQRVARLGMMYSKGLEDGDVMAVAKHFPGHGDTSKDSHKTLPTILHDKERLGDLELPPFKEYIDAGFSGMMIGHLNIPALDDTRQPSSLSYAITTDLLQKEMGFSGLVFTDGLQMKGVSGEDNYAVRALLAGNDILLGPVNTAREFTAVKKAVDDKVLSDSLIELKCKKVLSYKYILGVNNQSAIRQQTLLQELNSPNAEWINRRLNKAAITLLKDEERNVPLKKLDVKKIAAISVGETLDNAFHQTLKKYADVSCFSVMSLDDLQKLKPQLDTFNTLIVSVHNTRFNVNAVLPDLFNGKTSVFTFFTIPYRLSSYATSVKKADAVLLAYENTDLAQEYAAQALFGGNEVDGKLPVTVKGLFKEGSGLKRKKVRLSYTVPEEVGITSVRLLPIDSIANEGIHAQAFPGCQVLIAKDGEVIYNRSFGSFEYDRKRKVTNDDIYDLASMSKASATVPAVMKLYDDEKLRLSANISTFVPMLRNTDKADITIRQALLHETGLTSFIPYYMNAIDKDSYEGKLFNRFQTPVYSALFDTDTWARTDFKFKADLVSTIPQKVFLPLADSLYVNRAYNDTIISSIANSKLRKRKSYLYSCLNFMLLKEVVESVVKKDLNTYLQNKFYRRLGAVTTTYNPLTKFEKARIVPTEKDDFLRKQLIQGYVHDEGAAFMGGISGNAGLFSNANDLAKLYQMFLNKGNYGGEEYLSEKTCLLFTKTKSSTSRRGLGFDKPEQRVNKSSPCAPSAPASVYGHTGFTGTCFWIDPDNNLIYIFLSNRVYDKRTHNQISTLNIRSRIQEQIYKALRKTSEVLDNTIININPTENEQTDTE